MEDVSLLAELIREQYTELVGLKGDQAEELYRLLQEGHSQEEILDILFPGNKYGKKYLERLRRILKPRLANTLLVQELPAESSELLKVQHSCERKATLARILRPRGQRKAAALVAEEALKEALPYSLSDIVLSMAEELQLYHAIIAGDRKKFNYYSNLVEEYMSVKEAERVAQQYYCELVMELRQTKAHKQETIEKAKTYSAHLVELSEQVSTYWFMLIRFDLEVIFHQLTNDNEKVISTCRRAAEYFASLPFSALGPRVSFTYRMIPAYLQSGQFSKCQEVIEECLGLSKAGSYNWLVAMQYQILLGFQSGDYQTAQLAYQKSNEAAAAFPQLAEQWAIYQAYLEFLLPSGPDNGFRLARFLNNVPSFSKDKRGMNINILILQVLFLLRQGKRGEIIDRMDALKSYTSRYLRRNATFRSNCFIRLLLTLPQCSYHPACIERKSKPLLKKLEEAPASSTQQDLDLEVVPYEDLWGRVLRLL